MRLGVLERVKEYLKKRKYSWEVMVVDDGSDDGSTKLIQEFVSNHPNFQLIKNPHRGKAATVVAGMLAASGKYVLFSDLDQATPIDQIEKLLPWFSQGFDIVIGSRNTTRQGAPLSRVLMARGFMLLRTIILGLSGITDTQCGFKAFKNEVAKRLFSKLRIYGKKQLVSGSMVTAGFDIETLFIGKQLGYKIKEVPIDWHYVESRRVNPFKDSWHGFWDLIKIRLNSRRGLYD